MKKILLLKKEKIVPEVWRLSAINKWYYQKARKEIKKTKGKDRDIKIIADTEFIPILKELNLDFFKISDYVPLKYENSYEEALKLFKKWFSFEPLKSLEYNGISIKEVIEQEFCYTITDYINNLKLIDCIIKKERPDKVMILNDRTLFGLICKDYCVNNHIKIETLLKKRVISLLKGILRLTEQYSLFIRFRKIPFIDRREFVKTSENKIRNQEFVMFGVYDNNYYLRLKSIIDKANEKGIKVKGIVTSLNAQERAKKDNFEFFSFGDFFGYDKSLKDFKKELDKKWRDFSKENFDLKNRSNGIPIIYKEYFEYLFNKRFLWLGYYIKSYSNLFRMNKIKAVIVMDDLTPVNRSLVLVAKKNKVKNIVAPHGILIDNAGRGFVPLTADKMAVWGKIMKKQIAGFGIDPNRLIITGSYMFDRVCQEPPVTDWWHGNAPLRVVLEHCQNSTGYLNHSSQTSGILKFKESIKNKKSNKRDKFRVLLSIQKCDEFFAEKEVELIVKSAVDCIKTLKDIELNISLHPRISRGLVESAMKAEGLSVPINEGEIKDIIKDYDALITIYSTIAFDALLNNKPVISLNPMGRPDIIPYIKSGIALKATNGKELVRAINTIRSRNYINKWTKNKEKFLKDYLYKLDGKASERILGLI